MSPDSQTERLETLLNSFSERDIRYVALRGHPELSSSGSDSDIDTYVSSDSFDTAAEMCHQFGLSAAESSVENTLKLFARGIRKPRLAVELLGRSPRKLVSEVRDSVAVDSSTYQGYRDRGFEDGTLDVHLVNHLAYASPMNGKKIRVHPAVEQQLLDNCQQLDGVFVPAAPDELAHLVCRGVFDYEGQFPGYYVTRCNYLVEEVLASEPATTRFQDLLGYLFMGADSRVYELVVNRQYDEIRSILYQYSDY